MDETAVVTPEGNKRFDALFACTRKTKKTGPAVCESC
jgi:hypothetical protein